MTNVRKPLKDLNLMDRFLFAEAMEDPVIMQNVLEILLGKEIVLKDLPQTEKEQRKSSLKRFVKLDVWAWDIEDAIYDTEVQKKDTKNLPKRSRLYQALIDVNLLEPGEIDFNKMNKVYVMIIMPFDLFGYGLYRYTFHNQCEEIPGLSLDDEATRIFFNTHGTNKEGVSEELIELLHYIEHTTEEVSQECKSERIKDIQRRISILKSSEEIGVKYMQAWEEKIIERQEAREEGKKEGRKEGKEETLMELIQKKLSRGDSVSKIAEDLLETEDEIQSFMEKYNKEEE